MIAPAPVMPSRPARVQARRREPAELVQARAYLSLLAAVLKARDVSLRVPGAVEIAGFVLWVESVAVAMVRGRDVIVRGVRDPAEPTEYRVPEVGYGAVRDPDKVANVALEIELRIRVRRGLEAAASRGDEQHWCPMCDLVEVPADGDRCGRCIEMGVRHG